MKGYITQIRQVTHDVKSFHFALPNRPVYKPGQFLVWEVPFDDKVRKRAYSLASAPHWDNVEVLIKLHSEGKVTPKIFTFKEGDEVEIKMPFGTFCMQEPFPESMVFLAGGVGLSAMISMIRYLEHIDYQGEVVLLYGNRTPDDIVLKDELDRLARDWRLKLVHTIDHPDGFDWQGETGYISPAMIRKYCIVEKSNFFMCGPPQMIGHMVQNLDDLKVPHDRIFHEQW